MSGFSGHGRIEWIDIAKGVGIACVVLGHVSNIGLTGNIVYLFHMPLFFILSGYLFRPNCDTRRFARRKAIHLLIPYGTGVVLSGLVFTAHRLHHPPASPPIAHWLFALFWGGVDFDGVFGVLWFLTCLYLAQQLLNLIMLRVSVRSTALVMALLAVGGFLLATYCPGFSLPLDAHVVAMAAPLLFCGVLLKRHPIAPAPAFVIGAVSFAAGIILILTGHAAFVDMRRGFYGIPGLSIAIAIGCCIGVFAFCHAIAGIRILRAPLTQLGELSLPVMLIHKVIPDPHGLARHSPLLLFAFDLGIAWLLSYWITKYALGRLLFLGSEPDLKQLTEHRHQLVAR